MRDLAPIHQQLLKIERDFPVDQLICAGRSVWPIIRCEIAGKLFNLNSENEAPNEVSSLITQETKVTQEFSELVASLQKQLDEQPSNNSVRAAFFTFFFEYTQIQGVSYNKWLDPLKELLTQARIDFLDLDCGNYPENMPPRLFPNNNISSILEAAKFLAPSAGPISKLPEFFDYLNETAINIGLKAHELEKQLSQILAMQHVLAMILLRYRPRACFFVCFYHPIAYAICGACAQTGITAVDIQHGVMEPTDPFYGTWSNIPEEGYTFLPSRVWTWSQKSSATISSWNCSPSKHSSVLGGNPWLIKSLELDPNLQKRPQTTESPTLLFTCCRSPYQEITDLLPVALRDAIKFGPDNWRWILRLHYKMDTQTRNLIKEYFAPWSNKVLVQDPENINIYDVFKAAQHHLTIVSSTALEAEALGLTNIILGTVGYDQFRSEIESGVYLFADSGTELVNLITNRALPKARDFKIVETDKAQMQKVLLQLSGAQPDQAGVYE